MEATIEPANNEVAILSRAVQPERGDLSPDAARAILGLGISERDQERASELAAKARAGELSAPEESELNSYRHVGRMLELLKSKARLSLKHGSAV